MFGQIWYREPVAASIVRCTVQISHVEEKRNDGKSYTILRMRASGAFFFQTATKQLLLNRCSARHLHDQVRERAELSVRDIHTIKREGFCWAAILCTFALGSLAGDVIGERVEPRLSALGRAVRRRNRCDGRGLPHHQDQWRPHIFVCLHRRRTTSRDFQRFA